MTRRSACQRVPRSARRADSVESGQSSVCDSASSRPRPRPPYKAMRERRGEIGCGSRIAPALSTAASSWLTGLAPDQEANRQNDCPESNAEHYRRNQSAGTVEIRRYAVRTIRFQHRFNGVFGAALVEGPCGTAGADSSGTWDSAPGLTRTDASRRKAHAEWARRYRAESGL